MFISIPDEIFLEILKYLNNNRSVINFLKTFKYIKNLYYKYGYLKQINLDPLINNDPYNFALLSCKHSCSLNCIYIRGFTNPQHWILSWPKIVCLNSCTITDKIKSTSNSKTEILYINDIRSKKKIIIDWKSFPKLKEIYISSYNFNFDDMNKNLISCIIIK